MKKSDYIKGFRYFLNEKSLYKIPLRKEYLAKITGTGKVVLDAGCCGGKTIEKIAQNGNVVYGVEINEETAGVARTRGINVRVADLEEGIPFENEFFDVIHAGEIIEHLFDTEFFLKECYRVMKKNASLVVVTPNLNSIVNRITILMGFHIPFLGVCPNDRHGDHIRIFNLKTLKDLLKSCGLKPVECRGILNIPIFDRIFWFFPTLADYLLISATKKA